MSGLPTKGISPEENIIFLHLPKTAGSTINFILGRQYKPEIIYTIEGDTLAALKAFEQLEPASRKKIRVLKGHCEYGIHKFLHGTSRYLTFLRNPIDRIISDYYFILRSPQTPHHQYIIEHNLSLEEAVQSKDPLIMLPNTQTRLLAGVWRAGIEKCNDDILNQAKQNLRRHFVVGLTEKFDESICLFKSCFRWNNDVYYQKRNTSINRPAKETIPKDALEAIAKINQYDLQLYQYGQALFAEQIKQSGLLFPFQVKFYTLLNKAHTYEWFLQLLHAWHSLKNNWSQASSLPPAGP